MRHVCAWCNCEYGVPDDKPDLDFVTHGICAECEEHFQGNESESLRIFLNRFDTPILCVDDDVQLITANDAACEFLEKEPNEIGDIMCGEMVQCRWSRLPGGCGRTEHCVACAIRLMVNETLVSGENVEERMAFVDRFGDAGDIQRVRFRVSTERHGGTVLLRLQATD
jgi:PAS domain-containing protein